MAVYFPQLNSTGLITQRPYQSGLHYATSVVELPSGLRQRWGWRGMGLSNFPDRPLGQWELNYAAITDSEVSILRNFFLEMRGRWGEFTYLDPAGNLVPYSEQFNHSSWFGSITSGVISQLDPFGGYRAMGAISGTASCILLPDGASGIVLCLSVWVKLNSGGSVTLSLTGAGSTVTSVPAGTWVRVSHKGAVSGFGGISGTITLPGTGSVFGAQAVPMPGPGGYMRTPGNPGLHPKCRFDTDNFKPRYVGPNQISLTLPITEYW